MIPTAHVLALALLAAGEPEAGLGAAPPAAPPLIVDLELVGRVWASAREPETSMLWDSSAELWRVDDWLQPRAALAYPSLVVIAGLETEPRPGLAFRLLLDSGELRPGGSFVPAIDVPITVDGREPIDGLIALARVRELALGWYRGPVTVELGRSYTEIASDLSFADFATGLRLGVDLGRLGLPPLQLEAIATLVGHSLDELATPSPFASLRLDYELSPFERVGLFGAVFVDRNGTFHDPLISAAAERFIAAYRPVLEQVVLERLFLSERTTRGHLIYVGGEVSLLPAEGLSLRAAGTAAFGALRVGPSDLSSALTIRGYAANAEASYGILPELGVSLFGLALSGDQPPAGVLTGEAVYHAFLAVAPYWTWTGLFFSGGLTQGLFPARASAAGVNGHGVLGGGARASWVAGAWRGELCAAGLAAMAPPLPGLGGGGRVYGLETDLVNAVELGGWLTLGVEADLFWPGNFFVQQRVAYRLLGMARARVDH